METNQYLDMFIEESKEHLQSCNEQLLALESNPTDLSIVNEIFRSAHTLKGMSATMGYEDIADLTHTMENVLDAIRNEKLPVTSEMVDVVFQAVDALEEMVEDIATGGDGKKAVGHLVGLLNKIEAGESIAASNEVAATTVEEVGQQPITNLHYDDFEQTVIIQSFEQGFQAYEITTELRHDCILKAARAFMVFSILEDMGDVIKSSPRVEDIENEEFDVQFKVVLLTKEDAASIRAKIMKVSEVENVETTAITAETLKNQPEQSATPIVVASTPDASSKGSAPATNNRTVTQSSSNKTIRVNIERLDVLMNLFEELVIDRGRLQSISTELRHTELTETVERMTRISGDLQNIILNMRMIPVDTVF
jgi:two-component system chemotaxis sensor kinase CheA